MLVGRRRCNAQGESNKQRSGENPIAINSDSLSSEWEFLGVPVADGPNLPQCPDDFHARHQRKTCLITRILALKVLVSKI
jgi:hypothetical protein